MFHIPEFLKLYNNNNITIFNQQGLEKLNDTTTKYFQRGTNHCDTSALWQILFNLSIYKIQAITERKLLQNVVHVLKLVTTSGLVLWLKQDVYKNLTSEVILYWDLLYICICCMYILYILYILYIILVSILYVYNFYLILL